MVLVIDNYDSFTYNLVQYLGELGADVRVRRNDRITLGEIEVMAPDQIVISPGPGRPEDAGITPDLAGPPPDLGTGGTGGTAAVGDRCTGSAMCTRGGVCAADVAGGGYCTADCTNSGPGPGDINGDSNVDVTDLLEVINSWGPCPGGPASCPPDIDGDGTVEVDDLLLVLSNWG